MRSEAPEGWSRNPLTKGISHIRSRKTALGKIPETWEVKRLEHLARKISDGIHTTPKYSDEQTEFSFINGNNLKRGQICLGEKPKWVGQAEYDKHKKDLDSRTILMSINGTIGNLAFYRGETVVLGKSAAYISLDRGVDKRFIYHVLESERVQSLYELEVTGTTIRNLSI